MASSLKSFTILLLLALLVALVSAAPAPRAAPAATEAAPQTPVAMPVLKGRGAEMRSVREAAPSDMPRSPADLPVQDS
eukprot:CAMPEP_0174894294 /NCGR_PEP_ID=MMETSP0167-20121228/8950_1 /TAXON_ID=38298 /ORGANISM="Rhodella maculata, Strain CCMP736" /LENGTH=77 /DNA_ID=CAMNT_0016133335 /DNA_START=305 /DNA_END=538 /DNA_ORIENTATION=+